MFSPLFQELIEALRCLPGVGPKTAQRMALYLLQRDREAAKLLADKLGEAVDKVGHCKRCQTFTEAKYCQICLDKHRNTSILCILETPAEIIAIENATDYNGLYFVLFGQLSPLDGIGPEQLGIPLLKARLTEEAIAEIILALSPSPEAEVTMHYIADIAKSLNIRVSFLARGVPMGGEIEYLDASTLSHAFQGRHSI